jgi:hypothetical protein
MRRRSLKYSFVVEGLEAGESNGVISILLHQQEEGRRRNKWTEAEARSRFYKSKNGLAEKESRKREKHNLNDNRGSFRLVSSGHLGPAAVEELRR